VQEEGNLPRQEPSLLHPFDFLANSCVWPPRFPEQTALEQARDENALIIGTCTTSTYGQHKSNCGNEDPGSTNQPQAFTRNHRYRPGTGRGAEYELEQGPTSVTCTAQRKQSTQLQRANTLGKSK